MARCTLTGKIRMSQEGTPLHILRRPAVAQRQIRAHRSKLPSPKSLNTIRLHPSSAIAIHKATCVPRP